MAAPEANRPTESGAGGSRNGVRVATVTIHGTILAAVAVLLWLVYSLTASAEELIGKVIRVADGDTITVLDNSNKQHHVRLAGIDAPEKGQAYGNKSGESLAAMVAGRNVAVEWHKRDRYGRLVGQVFADSHDVCLIQLERGMAWHYKAYEREQRPEDARAYAKAEVEAKAASLGLWTDATPEPPWEWRRRKGIWNDREDNH